MAASRSPRSRRWAAAVHTLALGEQMRKAAAALEAKAGVPFTLLQRLTGLAAGDELMATLARISGRPVPQKYRRQRSQLVDAMLDGHFYFGGKQVAIGAEPDMLLNIGGWLADMGCTVTAAVTTTTFAGAGAGAGRRGADRRSRGSGDPRRGLRSAGDAFARPSGLGAARRAAVPHRPADVRPARRRASGRRSAIAAPAI